jgi:protein-S-isoprenylcysteine O-methyltransferase Ste14
MTRPHPAVGPPSPAARAAAWTGGVLFVASLAYFLYAYLVIFGRPAPPGPALIPAAIDVLLFSAFALHHSAFARTPLRAWIRRLASPRLERSIYVWISSLLLLGVCWLWRPVPGELYRLPGAWWWIGTAVQVAGIIVTHIASRALDPLELAGLRPFCPRPAAGHAHLVTSGLYRLVRHPVYFGWVLLVFGTPHMTMTRFVFALVSTAYLMAAIPWEEKGLVATFGAEYERYRQQVRWRMVPWVY